MDNGEKLPVVAICYDFDKTLSPDDMQAQGYIQSVGKDVDEFWKKSNFLARENGMDTNLAYMYMMVQEAYGQFVLNKGKLAEYGSQVQLFPGVEDWFERISNYGKEKGVEVEHYIISSGLKEMIEGTAMAQKGAFKQIYASSFYYDAKGVAVWPAQAVNYTNKTQFLFRIQKGVYDVNDGRVNDYFAPDEIRIPFEHMIYVGDSDTDVPCMKLVKEKGGYSIGVYNSSSSVLKDKVYKMIKDDRIDYFADADYREGQELDTLVKNIINSISISNKLRVKHFKDVNETRQYTSQTITKQVANVSEPNQSETGYNDYARFNMEAFAEAVRQTTMIANKMAQPIWLQEYNRRLAALAAFFNPNRNM